MDPKVIDISGRPHPVAPPVPDFWFAQVDHRLGRIEAMVGRLERAIWTVVCASAGLLILEIVKVLSEGRL
ncbi:hypothetical protein [Yoonia litorea]|uniref:Uncharacterized protein n=1 Tax=Yoonia litorea TaxID=1123755 RepID=A0A1I6LX68_9RHOB|nr:hypothetical protein [Yoonia litorea]SFS07974.1 hypothetical protein SAMN05444714_0979 [Yoonia litorea]